MRFKAYWKAFFRLVGGKVKSSKVLGVSLVAQPETKIYSMVLTKYKLLVTSSIYNIITSLYDT